VALILLATWLEGGSPLYLQARVGRGGALFRCWKVRTMVRGADELLARLVEEDDDIAREWHHHQKLTRDPRITRLGRLLRRSSLDELPQLWNVLNGTMSLVGPRPFTPAQRGLYAGGRGDLAYYDLRPGISGLWQVSRRNAGSFAERVSYDEQYGRSVSLLTDLSILWRTFAVVLRATGR
jgi:lipopolysaccharide/colanic/teichoic acid biosynthesis glycosyltransferase